MRSGSDPTPASRRRRAWIVLAWLVAIGAAVAPAVWLWLAIYSLSSLSETNDGLSRADVEAFGNVQLPPDVGDLRARLHTCMTKQMLMARFSIAPGELPDLLASGDFRKLPDGSGSYLPQVWAQPDWWTPETARSHLTAETAGGSIMVDEDRPDRYVVYLVRRW
ncbi:MAG TPA: hypothetical protein VKQ32_14995 [Polyangia bacterium]|nr:hypothetical protein [Polyangia bacterium]